VQEICPLGSTWRGLQSTGGGQCCGSALPARRQSSTLPTRPGDEQFAGGLVRLSAVLQHPDIQTEEWNFGLDRGAGFRAAIRYRAIFRVKEKRPRLLGAASSLMRSVSSDYRLAHQS